MGDVGDGEVGAFAIDRGSPFDAAEHAPAAGAVLPDDVAGLLRVEGITDSGFLPDDDKIASAGRARKHWWAAEVEVRPVGRRAVRVSRAAAGQVDVVGRDLFRPAHGAGLQVERHDGVARGVRWAAVLVAGSDVEQAAPGVHGWRGPDRRTRWPPERNAGRARSAALRFLRNRVRLPQDVP